MNRHIVLLFNTCCILLTVLSASCNIKRQTDSINEKSVVKKNIGIENDETFKYGAGDIVYRGFVDKYGNLWFTTSNEGVYKYNGERFINITEQEGLCSNHVSAVVEDDAGVLWFATNKGLCAYDGNSFKQLSLPQEDTLRVSPKTGFPSRQTEQVMNMMIDRKGNFWLGTDAAGAYLYDGKTFTSFLQFAGRLQPDSVYNNCITSILEDQEGNIWFTSMTHGGISKYDGSSLVNFGVDDGLLGDMITSSFEDQSGNIWFGSIQNLEGGISKYDGTSFTNYTVKDGLCDSNVVCFYEDESGIIWIGTGNGVCYYNGNSFTHFKKGGQSLGDIRFIMKDQEGNIWFGGRYGVLWRYNGNELEDFTFEKRKS